MAERKFFGDVEYEFYPPLEVDGEFNSVDCLKLKIANVDTYLDKIDIRDLRDHLNDVLGEDSDAD